MDGLRRFWRDRTTLQRVGIVVFAILAVVALSGFGRGGPTSNQEPPQPAGQRAAEFALEHGGDPAVHEEVFLDTDCGSVQARFNRAAADDESAAPGTPESSISRGLMIAASARLREVGC